MALTNAKELAEYICYYYKKCKYDKDISPIKLQKSLYFLLAYWGGYIRKGKDNINSVEEKDIISYDELLFDDEIQAWTYGPVVASVYHNMNLLTPNDSLKDKIDEFVLEFINDVLNDIFDVSDFKLVDISHMDRSWINHYHKDDNNHNEVIPHTEIIEEYARR